MTEAEVVNDIAAVLAKVRQGVEIVVVARIGGEQAAKGINLPLADLIIGACALELGYAVGTNNIRDFRRIPGLAIVQL
jgi:predicted nucleic acid-binding protein